MCSCVGGDIVEGLEYTHAYIRIFFSVVGCQLTGVNRRDNKREKKKNGQLKRLDDRVERVCQCVHVNVSFGDMRADVSQSLCINAVFHFFHSFVICIEEI